MTPKCPECAAKGITPAAIRVGNSFSTLLACWSFYDADGRLHHDDPNAVTQHFHCSNGHSWVVRSCGGKSAATVTP